MNDADRDLLRSAFSIELAGPPPGAEQRVLGGLNYRGHARRETRWLAVVAAALGALVVATLVGSRALTARAPLTVPGSQPVPTATAAPFPCRLPIERGGVGEFVLVSSGQPSTSAVVSEAEGTVDPAGSPHLPDGEGAAALTYSWQLRRWLPVAPDWVSPDGAQYAYSDRLGVLHVVRSDGTRDRAVNRDRAWSVIAFRTEGVFVAAVSASATPSGLWLVDPATGRAQQLQATGTWVAVSAGAAWELTLTNPAPPPPRSPLPGEVTGNVLVRLDLATGETTPMYSSQTSRVRFLGVDAEGDALAAEVNGLSGILVVSGPGRVASYLGGDWTEALADGDRTWISDNFSQSIVLKSGGDVARLLEVDPQSGGFRRVAGPCR